jgi:lipid A disaccharide synthetase
MINIIANQICFWKPKKKKKKKKNVTDFLVPVILFRELDMENLNVPSRFYGSKIACRNLSKDYKCLI